MSRFQSWPHKPSMGWVEDEIDATMICGWLSALDLMRLNHGWNLTLSTLWTYPANWEFLWCQLCHHWWHQRLSLWLPTVPPRNEDKVGIMTTLSFQWIKCFMNISHSVIWVSRCVQGNDFMESVMRHILYNWLMPCLTHLPLDKMVAISQTIFSDAFLWMKSFIFQLQFHWSLFLSVQLTISHHWFR